MQSNIAVPAERAGLTIGDVYVEVFVVRHQADERAVRSLSRCPGCPDARPDREGRWRSRRPGWAVVACRPRRHDGHHPVAALQDPGLLRALMPQDGPPKKSARLHSEVNWRSSMSKPASRPLDCPSAQAGAKDARVYGVLTGTLDAPHVGYLTETQPVTDKVLAPGGPAEPTSVFRIAPRCETTRCKHFRGNECTLAQRIVEGLAPVVNALPPCQIRPTCRWFHQEGRNACLRCPQVVTDKPSRTAEEKRIADCE